MLAVVENQNLLRNEQNYVAGLHGIKEFCLLNYLNNYRVYRNFSADLMHDLFLGVFRRGLNEILIYLLDLGFTVKEINDAFSGFDWGTKDGEYYPETFTENKIRERTINLYAREVWAAIDYLPFFLRRFLGTDNEVYQFGLIMVDILDLVLKSKITDHEINRLNETIERHNNTFIRLFGELIPKMHYMLHYKRLIKLFGPLRLLWCFASERKHQFVKRYTNVCKSRRNLGFSIAKKMGIANAQLTLNKENIFKKIKEVGKQVVPRFEHLMRNFPNYQSSKYVEYKGIEYNIGDFIFENENEIACIIEIFVNLQEDNVYLITQKYKTEFVPHLRSYKINEATYRIVAENIDHFNHPPVNKHEYFENHYIRIRNF